jgi:uncharacterized membrane protein YphA (DoxX/SURF4 family)
VTQTVTRTVEEFIQFASQLPDMNKIYYELDLTNYAAKNMRASDYDEILAYLNSCIANRKQNQPLGNILFSSFFLLCIYSRRMKNYSVYSTLLKDYGKYFDEHPLFPHIQSQYHKNFHSPDHMKWTIEYARESVENTPLHIGVLHNYVEAIVTAKENHLEISDSLWQDAQLKMNQVAKHNLYAKFHCTRGRLLALLGKYAEAKLAIHEAIDQEVSTSKDYAIRVNEFQAHLMRIQTMETATSILTQLENTQKEFEASKNEMHTSMDKLQKDNLQFLGFFVAIISLTIGSLNIIGDKTFIETALLILILTGSIILGYVTLGFLFNTSKSSKYPQMIALFIGILFIVGSILVHYFMG